MDNQKNIARFEAEWAKVKRPGAERLLAFIRNSDFFTAPASTRFHLSVEGGLLQHSLNVLDALRGMLTKAPDQDAWEYRVAGKTVDRITDESLVVIAFTHDLCKTYFYGIGSRNVKNDKTKKWEKVPIYTIEDKMPIGGHGFKSAFLAKEYMALTTQEFYAIRWHMGFSDAGEETGTLRAAIAKFPIVWAVHTADMMASCFMEANAGNQEAFTPPAEDSEAEAAAEPEPERAPLPENAPEAEPEYQEAPPIGSEG